MALVIKWIKNPASVTRKELVDNANAALADSPIIYQSITAQAAVSAANSVVSASKTKNKVAYRKMAKLQKNDAIKHVNTYLKNIVNSKSI